MNNATVRRHSIIRAIKRKYDEISNYHLSSTIAKVVIPQTLKACREWILRVESRGAESDELIRSGLNLGLTTDFLKLFNWWVDYNLWARFCKFFVPGLQTFWQGNRDADGCYPS